MVTKIRKQPDHQRTDVAARWTDEELFLRYRKTGDRSCFAQLARRYEHELYNYLRRYLGDAEMAEDVFQTTFLLVHLKGEQFQAERRFRPWLYAIATNAAVDARRRNKRHRAISLDRVVANESARETVKLADILVSQDPDPPEQADRQESGKWIQQALNGLSEQMRTVILLVYYQGLKYREAAEVLNIPVGTVKSRMHAALQKLSELWASAHGD